MSTNNEDQALRQIPHSECAQGRCGSLPTGCRGECDLKRTFALNNIACGDPVEGGQVHPESALPSVPVKGTPVPPEFGASVGITPEYRAAQQATNEAASTMLHALSTPSPRVSEQADERALNLLESCANWLSTRSETVWAKEFAHDGLMRQYAIGLQSIRAALTQQAAPEAPTETQCDNCDGKGGWKTGEWIDPVSGPECSYERCEVCMGTGREPIESPVAAPEAPASDERADEAKRLRRVVNALNMGREVPDDDATLRDCLFAVLGQIAYKLERASPAATTASASGMPPVGTVEYMRARWGAPASREAAPLEATAQNAELVLRRLEQLHQDSIPGGWRELIEEAMPCALAVWRAALAQQSAERAAPSGDDTLESLRHTVSEQRKQIASLLKQVAPVGEAVRDAWPDEEALRDGVMEGLRGLYGCGRVWSAWSVGTMTENDFYPADESDECIHQVMDAIRALRSTSTPTEGAAS